MLLDIMMGLEAASTGRTGTDLNSTEHILGDRGTEYRNRPNDMVRRLREGGKSHTGPMTGYSSLKFQDEAK